LPPPTFQSPISAFCLPTTAPPIRVRRVHLWPLSTFQSPILQPPPPPPTFHFPLSNLQSPILHSLLSARSEEHTSELQSLMRISYAVFCLKKKNTMNPIR